MMVLSVIGLYAGLDAKYVRKEIMTLVIDRLDRIEQKVDIILQQRAQ